MKTLKITIYSFVFLLAVWVYYNLNYEPVIDIQPVYMYSPSYIKEEIKILEQFLANDSISEERKNELKNRIEYLKN